jgi:hypothetical protein
MANAQKCQEVLDFILMHPERHDQGDWAMLPIDTFREGERPDICDTAVCAAGTAALLDNRLSLVAEGSYIDEKGNRQVIWDVSADFYNPEGENFSNWEDLGAYLLGLTEQEAACLFGASNSRAIKMLKRLANNEPIIETDENGDYVGPVPEVLED